MTYRKIEQRQEEYYLSDDFYEIRNDEGELIAIILDRGKKLNDNLATIMVIILNNFKVDSDIIIEEKEEESWECQCSDCIRKRAEQVKP
jgi:hypothetical protein